MWIPRDEAELLAAVTAGVLEENASFDAKQEVGKNEEIAKDIAAMANDGGVIIYGIAEDQNKRPTIPHPIVLAYQRERINAISQSSINEPVTTHITAIPTTNDPSLGYVVVVVPMSPRAPHMVTVRGDDRYYGRTATGNIILSQPEVARLYERRRRWEIDANVLLDSYMEDVGIEQREGVGFLYLIASPLARHDQFLESSLQGVKDARGFLRDLVNQVVQHPAYYDESYPRFNPPSQVLQQADGYLLYLQDPSRANPRNILDLAVNFDGSTRLFCGRAAEREGAAYLFLPTVVAGAVLNFLAFTSLFYQRAGYVGDVDLAIAVTGLKGTIAYRGNVPHIGSIRYDRDIYRRTLRVSAIAIQEDVYPIATDLLQRLFHATSQGGYDPIARYVEYLARAKNKTA